MHRLVPAVQEEAVDAGSQAEEEALGLLQAPGVERDGVRRAPEGEDVLLHRQHNHSDGGGGRQEGGAVPGSCHGSAQDPVKGVLVQGIFFDSFFSGCLVNLCKVNSK